jgi:hypothetical protein
MKLGTEDKKKLGIAIALGIVAIGSLGYLYVQLFGGPSAAPAPAAQVAPVVVVKPNPGGAAAVSTTASPGGAKVVAASVSLDPTLHTELMDATESLVYSGSGRNIFQAGPSDDDLKKIAASAPPPRGPIFPTPGSIATNNQPVGPPPKPPINLKFFGIATQNGKQKALLLSGEDVFLASAGDVVARRYRIIAVNARSVTVEDVPNNNRQDLPLVGN